MVRANGQHYLLIYLIIMLLLINTTFKVIQKVDQKKNK